MGPIRERRKEGRILSINAVSETFQFQVAHDFFLHQAGEVGSSGNAISRPDFLGDGAAPDHLAGFKNDDLAPGFGEVCGGDESVMAAADDDYIEFRRQASMIAGPANTSRSLASGGL